MALCVIATDYFIKKSDNDTSMSAALAEKLYGYVSLLDNEIGKQTGRPDLVSTICQLPLNWCHLLLLYCCSRSRTARELYRSTTCQCYIHSYISKQSSDSSCKNELYNHLELSWFFIIIIF